MRAEGVEPGAGPRCEVFAVPLGHAAKRRLVTVVAALRGAGVSADLAYGDRGLKGAMKAADRSGARLTLVAGDRDLADGVVQLKDMSTGEQDAITLADVVTTVEERLS
jgi:histidyl-tRNA synthetase